MQPMLGQPGFFFYNARGDFRYDGTGHLLLTLDAPLLGRADGAWQTGERSRVEAAWMGSDAPPEPADLALYDGRPILLLDATWKRLPEVARCVTGEPVRRSLPDRVRTAYPRVNQQGQDPGGGLATIEALYLALGCLGHDRPDVLAHYHWRELFLGQFGEAGSLEDGRTFTSY